MVEVYFPKFTQQGGEYSRLERAVMQDRKLYAKDEYKALKEKVTRGFIAELLTLVSASAMKMEISEDEVAKNPPTHFWTDGFLNKLPTFRTQSVIYLHLYINKMTEIKVNHAYDVFHLAVAVPYCDIVVTDKEMVHIVATSGLAADCGTGMFDNLEDALDFLERSQRP